MITIVLTNRTVLAIKLNADDLAAFYKKVDQRANEWITLTGPKPGHSVIRLRLRPCDVVAIEETL